MAAIEQLNLLSQDIKVVSEPVLQKSEFEELIEALEFVQTIEEFASITEGSSKETVKDAVLYLESPAQKQQINRWLETLDFPE
jgi:AAA+ ATPase superfamily predicted ATPase